MKGDPQGPESADTLSEGEVTSGKKGARAEGRSTFFFLHQDVPSPAPAIFFYFSPDAVTTGTLLAECGSSAVAW